MKSFLRHACRLFAAAFLLSLTSMAAHAQGQYCANPAITNAIHVALKRWPNATGNSGECNPANYGGGTWNGDADLIKRVGAASYCTSPWIGQIYLNLYNRYPNNDECNPSHYGGGRWTNYMDLTAKVQQYKSGASAPAAQPVAAAQGGPFIDLAHGVLNDGQGHTIPLSEVSLIGQDGAGLSPQQASALIAAGGGNLIAAGGGNLIAAGGGNYHVQSVGSKKVFIVKKK